MSIVQAYKSDIDGKLFENKNNYIKHLRKLAGQRLLQKREEKLEREREAFLVQMGQVKSIDELNQFIKDNWRWFWLNGVKRNSWRSQKGTPSFHEYVDVSITNVRWVEKVSNSHCCPRKGVENFDTRADYNKGKPTCYPGWEGRINIKVRTGKYNYKGKEYSEQGFGSDYFENTIINTGTGGGGGLKAGCTSYSYDVKLFAADFPVMHEIVRREQWVHLENERRKQIWRTLGGKGQPTVITDIPNDWVCPDPMISQAQYIPLYSY
jgi:hypothetical protein